MDNCKPAVCIDDSPRSMTNIARAIRLLGELPVIHFPSVEAFLRHHDIDPTSQNLEGLKSALEQYSVMVCDNNLEAARKDNPYDGWIEGASFLLYSVGPALAEITQSERPLVICFGPSSEEILDMYKEPLWDGYGIHSFLRTYEAALIGFTVRVIRENAISLSRESIIENILGLDPTKFELKSEKIQFCLQMQDPINEFFPDEARDQVAGEAKPMTWDTLIDSISQHLNIPPDEINLRISREVDLARRNLEGSAHASNPER